MTNQEIEELCGKYVLLCYDVVDSEGKLLAQFQEAAFFHGITSVIHMRLDDSFEEIYLPPDLTVFVRAEPGKYLLRSTGQEIIDPDYTASWTITCQDSRSAASIPRYQPETETFA